MTDQLVESILADVGLNGVAPTVAAVGSVRDRYPALDWAELFAAEPDQPDWLIEPLIEVGQSVALFGAAKSGKSLLTLEWAAALAAGRPVLGNVARPPVRVLYADLENRPADIRDRLCALGYGPDDLVHLSYLSLPPLPPLDSVAGGAELAAAVTEYRAELLVLDTASRVVGGGENDADTYAALYRHAIAPLRAKGVSLIRLDHSGKDETRGQRGSSAKDADVDAVWQLSARTDRRLTLRRTRSRTGRGDDLIELNREFEPLRHARTGLSVPDDVARIIGELDRLRTDPRWGRDRVRVYLRENGVTCGTDLLAEALRQRRPVRGQVADRSGERSAAVGGDLSAGCTTRSVGQPDRSAPPTLDSSIETGTDAP